MRPYLILPLNCNKHAPLKKVPKRKVNYIYKPWITKQILPYIIAKNKLAAKRHQNPTEFKKARKCCEPIPYFS